MGRRRARPSRALEVLGTARRSRLLRVLREVGLAGQRPETAEAAREFRLALEELGTTYVKLAQLLSSRPDLMPDAYIVDQHLRAELDFTGEANNTELIARIVGAHPISSSRGRAIPS